MKKILFAMTLICLVVTVSVTAVSFSKYYKEQTIGDVSTIAQNIVNFSSLVPGDNTYSLPLDSMSPSENEKTYSFTVSNTNGTTVSEVAQGYTLSLISTGNLPINITFKKGDSVIGTLSPTNLSVTSGLVYFDAGITKTDSYTLFVEWQNENVSGEYSNLIDNLEISIDWEQID